MPAFRLLLACLSCSLSTALAQTRPSPAYFLRHPAGPPVPGLVLPAPSTAVMPAAGVIPTLQAAARYGVLPPTAQVTSLPSSRQAPRRDLTGTGAFPSYDPLQNLPEFYRQHTLPEARIEPWPVQLLRGLL